MHDPYLAFDGPYSWGDGTLPKGYEIDVYAGGDGWLPHIEIEPEHIGAEFHFIRHGDDIGVYTPGYVVTHDPPWVLSIPDDVPVPKWMPAAIERAGFGYDPVPNNERWRSDGIEPHPEQSGLVV